MPTNAPELFTTPLGDSHNKLDFILVAMQHFGNDTTNNINNLDGFQSIRKWFNRQNRSGIYPDLGAGKTVTGVFATTDGYIEGTTESAGRYQVECRVEYTQENESETKLPRFIRED